MITVTVSAEDRKLTPSSTNLGNENDNRYESLQFVVPEIFEQQSVFVCYQQADERLGIIMLDSSLTWDLGRYIMSAAGTLTIFLRIISSDERVWNSMPCRFKIKNLFDVDAENPPFDDTDWLERVLAEMAGYATTTEDCKETVVELHQEVVYKAAEVQSNTEIAQDSAQRALSSAASARNSAKDADASADEAADQASQAGSHAARAAQSAQAAADSAQEAQETADSLDFPQVEVETLLPDQPATARWDTQGENPVLVLGLPKGRDGKGVGDMVKADYDRNNDGVVDKAESLTGTIGMEQVNGLVGHVTDHTNPHHVTARQTGAATAMEFGAVLPASGWAGDAAPYSQEVAIAGILESDTPVVDVALTGDETADNPVRQAWAQVSRMVTGNGTITAWAWEKPTVDIPITLQCTRGNGRGFGGSLSATAIQASASGDIATVDNAAALPALSAVAMIEPVQEGEGEPYPPGGGKNLLLNTATSQTYNGVTYTVNQDGSVTANGTAGDGNSWCNLCALYELSPGTYILSDGGAGNSGYYIFIDRMEPEERIATTQNGDIEFVQPDHVDYGTAITAKLVVESGTTVNNVTFYPMIRLASDTDATYQPYSNIRPITGHDGCKIVRAGKNLLDLAQAIPVANSCIIEGDRIRLNITNANMAELRLQYLLPMVKNGTTMTFSVKSGIAERRLNILVEGRRTNGSLYQEVYSEYGGRMVSCAISDFEEITMVSVRVARTQEAYTDTDTYVEELQLELGSTATEYEPYQGDTYSASFPRTVYGGSYDFVTGKLTVDRGFIESYAGETLPGVWISSMDVYQAGAVPTTGAQVCYELASPLTYDLTPQQVDMLFGLNNVWSDTGESRVVYIVDTKTYVDDTVSGLGLIVADGKLCMEVDG